MTNAPAPRSQPTPEPVRQHSPLPWSYRPWDYDDWGFIRADDGSIAATARGSDHKSHDEHRVAGTDPYGPNALFIVEAVNSHASLTARAEQAERSVDVLESNAREQAKLLADTGRRVEELEAALRGVLSSSALTAMEGCDCQECAPIARAYVILGVARAAREL